MVSGDASQYFSSDLNCSSLQTLEVKAESHLDVAEKRPKENGKDTCLDDNQEKTYGIESSVPSLCVQSPSESEGEEGVDEEEENGSREVQSVEALNENEQRINKDQIEPNEDERLCILSQSARESECHSPTRSSSKHLLCTPITSK